MRHANCAAILWCASEEYEESQRAYSVKIVVQYIPDTSKLLLWECGIDYVSTK